MTYSILDQTIDLAGAGAILMVSPVALDDIRHNTGMGNWKVEPGVTTYRGALIEVHDEWSWGWMVRDKKGGFTHLNEVEK